jgi:hypothetical protein
MPRPAISTPNELNIEDEMDFKIQRASSLTIRAILVVLLGVVGFYKMLPAQAASTPSGSVLHVLNAIGDGAVAVSSPCTESICPGTDTCNSYQLTGHLTKFYRFGPAATNPSVLICITEDSTKQLFNGCSPATGTVQLSSNRGKTVSMSLAGDVCALPATSPTLSLSVVNAAFVITGSEVGTVARGSGSFSAFFSSTATATDASFTFDGNFSD